MTSIPRGRFRHIWKTSALLNFTIRLLSLISFLYVLYHVIHPCKMFVKIMLNLLFIHNYIIAVNGLKISTRRLITSMNEMWLSKLTHAARSQISSGFGVKSNVWWRKWTGRLAAVLLLKLGTLERVNASHRGKTMAVIPCVKPHAESVNNSDLKCTKSGKTQNTF